MNINRVFIAGRITQTPEIRYTPNGSAVCEFSMATNRKYKSGDETKEETCFHSVVAWGKTAEIIAHHFQKGSEIYIEGRQQQDTWVDKESGKNRSKIKVVAENFQFVGPKTSQDAGSQTTGAPPPQYQQSAPPPPIPQNQAMPPVQQPAQPNMNDEQDNIPF